MTMPTSIKFSRSKWWGCWQITEYNATKPERVEFSRSYRRGLGWLLYPLFVVRHRIEVLFPGGERRVFLRTLRSAGNGNVQG